MKKEEYKRINKLEYGIAKKTRNRDPNKEEDNDKDNKI